MGFLHDGRPPVVREAVWEGNDEGASSITSSAAGSETDFASILKAILSSLNVCSKEWIIRQYDHEVQSGSVVKPAGGRGEPTALQTQRFCSRISLRRVEL